MAIRRIPFRRDMQEAIDAGLKTQTRRPVRLPRSMQECNEDHDWELDGDPPWPYAICRKTGCLQAIECPCGEPDDHFVVLGRTYEITAIRIEQVQSISDADVRAEGVPKAAIDKWRQWLHPNDCAGHAFSEIWDLKYRKTFPWASNCFIWVLTFKRVRDISED